MRFRVATLLWLTVAVAFLLLFGRSFKYIDGFGFISQVAYIFGAFVAIWGSMGFPWSCDVCDGRGYIDRCYSRVKCVKCKGTGYIHFWLR
jgi:hypothetical protein